MRSPLFSPWNIVTVRSISTKRGGIFEAQPPKGFGPRKRFTTRRAAKTYLRQRRMIANRQHAAWAGKLR